MTPPSRISEIEQRNKIMLERFSPQNMAIPIEAAKEPYYTVVVENIRLDQQSIEYLLTQLKREREANAVMRDALEPFAELLPHVSMCTLSKEFMGDYWNPAIKGPDIARARAALDAVKKLVEE